MEHDLRRRRGPLVRNQTDRTGHALTTLRVKSSFRWWNSRRSCWTRRNGHWRNSRHVCTPVYEMVTVICCHIPYLILWITNLRMRSTFPVKLLPITQSRNKTSCAGMISIMVSGQWTWTRASKLTHMSENVYLLPVCTQTQWWRVKSMPENTSSMLVKNRQERKKNDCNICKALGNQVNFTASA